MYLVWYHIKPKVIACRLLFQGKITLAWRWRQQLLGVPVRHIARCHCQEHTFFFFIGAAVRTTKLSKRSSVCCHMQVVWCAEDIGTELLKVTLTTTVFRLTTRGPGVPTRLGEREVGIGVEVQITDGSLRYELLWLSKRKTKLKTSQEQQWSKGHTCNGITLLASRRELRSVESKLAEVKWMDGWMDELAEPV